MIILALKSDNIYGTVNVIIVASTLKYFVCASHMCTRAHSLQLQFEEETEEFLSAFSSTTPKEIFENILISILQ